MNVCVQQYISCVLCHVPCFDKHLTDAPPKKKSIFIKVEGGVVADDVEAEIRASRQRRRGTRSHHRFGGSGSHNGFGSSSSSGGVPRTVGAGLSTDQFFDSTVSADGYGGGNHHHHNHHSHHNNSTHNHNHHHQQQRQFQHQQHQQQQRVPAEWADIDNGDGNSDRSLSGSRGWDSGNNNTRGQGHKRERPELRGGGGADGGWGASLRGFRGGGGGGGGIGRDSDSHSQRSGSTIHGGGGGDVDCGGSAFMGVSGTTSQTSSPPPSIMSSDDVSVSSYGHPVTVLPGSPNNMRFDGRPPPSLAKIRLEAVRSPVVRRNGGSGRSRAGRGAGGLLEHGGPVFTSPDASKHVHELCSPRSAFTPRSASSVSSLASSRGRR